MTKGINQKEGRCNMDWLGPLNLMVSVIAIIASFYAIKVGYSVNIRLNQYNIMSQLQSDLIDNLYEEENYLDRLMLKYEIKYGEENELIGKMSFEDKQALNAYIARTNCLLARLFIIMPDKSYQTVINTIKPRQIKLRDLRETLLVELRQTQHSKTKFKTREDIKFIYPLK